MDVFERHPHFWSVRTTSLPILSRPQVSALAARVRTTGGRVVFTNGVFDLIHPGHVRYLSDARALGDALIVAINSDRSVRVNKGPSRPITPEHERAELIAALRSVDAVTVFDEDTPHAVIAAIQPDVLVKGADWGPDNIVGRDIVEARGGSVVRLELAEGFSSTRLIDKARAARS
jgi:D-beta-D-heptose 7-phosphate kinase/D-beta-D-heptose 1-phosphate adenosyltransferase